MPSLQDIANQMNATLSQIQTNTSSSAATDVQIKADTGALKTELASLITQDQTDFSNLSAGLAKIIDEQSATNALLDYERQQDDTIVCWLSKIADLLCTVVHRLDTEIGIQSKIRDDIKQIKETGELVHGSETVEVLRRLELSERIANCCDKPKPEPKPCFEPCAEPPYVPYKPQVGNYQPLPPVQNPAGIK